MAITLRLVKGSELTFAEVDDNFKSLYFSASIDGTTLSLFKTGSSTDTINLSGISGDSFPYTGSAAISGTLIVEGPAGHITASGNISSSKTGSFGYITVSHSIVRQSKPSNYIKLGDTSTLINSHYGGPTQLQIGKIGNTSSVYNYADRFRVNSSGSNPVAHFDHPMNYIRFYLPVTSSEISASLVGTSSWAVTASHALNGGGGSTFPYTGSAAISGTLTVEGPAGHITASGNISSSANITGDIGTFKSSSFAGGISVNSGKYIADGISVFGDISSSGTTTMQDGDVKGNLTVGGNLDIADTIYHTGDSNTKIRFPAVDTIAFNTNGVERLSISPAGHITASGNISSSGTIRSSVYSASTGFYADANTGFEFNAQGDNQLNFKHQTPNKSIFFLTALGSGSINLGTSGSNSEFILNMGHITASGNISASGGFTGSLYGTSSWAVTASHALNAGGGGSAFPHSGSAQITGSLNVTGSTTLHNANNSITSLALQVEGSGSVSGSNIFEVIGSAGTLFAVSDGLSGSLFSVNDVSGIPVLEVRSDDSVLMGNNTSPSFNTTVKVTTLSGSDNTLFTLPTSSYDGVFVDYTLTSGSNARAGNMMAITIPGTQNATYTDTATSDIGSTATVELSAAISESTIRFRGDSSGTSTWTFKAIIRAI